MNAASILPEFDQEMTNARVALSRIPDAEADFKPDPRSFGLMELGAHIANIPVWLDLTLTGEELDLSQPMDRPPVPASTSDLLARFDENLASGREALAAATPEDLATPWTLRNGDHVIFTLPRAAVIRTMVLNHLIHHRGQLTVYLRLVGAPVPGMYGPSADES